MHNNAVWSLGARLPSLGAAKLPGAQPHIYPDAFGSQTETTLVGHQPAGIQRAAEDDDDDDELTHSASSDDSPPTTKCHFTHSSKHSTITTLEKINLS